MHEVAFLFLVTSQVSCIHSAMQSAGARAFVSGIYSFRYVRPRFDRKIATQDQDFVTSKLLQSLKIPLKALENY